MTYYLDQTATAPYVLDYAPAEPAASRTLQRWLTLVVVMAALMAYRPLLWYAGFHISQRLVAATSAVLLLIALAFTAWRAVRSLGPQPVRHAFSGRLIILTVWIVWMTAWGLVRQNFPNEVFKQAVGFLMLVLFLLLGRYDAIWQSLRKPLVVVFYISFVLVLLTYRIPGIATSYEGTSELKTEFVTRNMNTIGFSLGGIMQVALLLGAWGLAQRRKDIWGWLMLGALPAYLGVQVLLFEFRGSLISLVAIVGLFAFLSPRARGRIPVGAIVGILLTAGIALALAAKTDALASLIRRFQEGNFFHSRNSEAQAFFNDMGPLDLVAGRGLGGWYEGPRWSHGLVYNGHRMWWTNHFGFLGFVLRGGFPLLLFVSTFAIPVFLPKPAGWRLNEYNFAAMILTPVLLLFILVSPLTFDPDGFFFFVMLGFCFARFSTAATDSQEWSTEAPQEIAYEY